jgi:hypothetical protein
MKLPLITAIALSAAMWQISFAQTLTSDQLAQRTIERRAVEAVNWGMSAVNYDLMLQEMLLVACVIAVFCIGGWLPGHIARTRGHPWAEAVTMAGWVTLICGFALWPIALIWAYVDVPRPSQERPQ